MRHLDIVFERPPSPRGAKPPIIEVEDDPNIRRRNPEIGIHDAARSNRSLFVSKPR
jgi:hypothetical protein